MTTAAWTAPYHAEAFSARQGRCYRLATDKLDLPATVCVLVDHVAANLPPAAEVGMATIHHTDSSATIDALEGVLGLPSDSLLDPP